MTGAARSSLSASFDGGPTQRVRLRASVNGDRVSIWAVVCEVSTSGVVVEAPRPIEPGVDVRIEAAGSDHREPLFEVPALVVSCTRTEPLSVDLREHEAAFSIELRPVDLDTAAARAMVANFALLEERLRRARCAAAIARAIRLDLMSALRAA